MRRDKVKKQLVEDFNLAKELSVTEVWKVPVVKNDEYGACCSKNVINSVSLPNEPTTITTPEVLDDAVIAQLMQAEFDLEYDEDLKRRENNFNKSKIVKMHGKLLI